MRQFITKRTVFTFLVRSLVASTTTFAKPKYGPDPTPNATPLSKANDFFRQKDNPQPQFWALISFYIPQRNGASCSSAAAAMVLNAARAQLTKAADEKVISEAEIVEKTPDPQWKLRVSEKGDHGAYGMALEPFGVVLQKAAVAYGFPKATITSKHIQDTSDETKAEVREILKTLSMNHLVVANFDQKAYTNDEHAGHFAPVAAYDPKKDKVLILDPDRSYYEPYWVSLDTFVNGMSTQDSESHLQRGLVVLTLDSSK